MQHNCKASGRGVGLRERIPFMTVQQGIRPEFLIGLVKILMNITILASIFFIDMQQSS